MGKEKSEGRKQHKHVASNGEKITGEAMSTRVASCYNVSV